MISQQSFQGYTQLAYIFVEYFYEAATSGYTVHNALNVASEESSVFHTILLLFMEAIWHGTLAVRWVVNKYRKDMITQVS